MQEFLANPAVQGGLAPFLAALVVAVALQPLRMGGLAAVAAFLTGMYLVSGLAFTPLTATRKVVVLGMATPIVGLLMDFAFKPTRVGIALVSLGAGAAALWAFWPVLAQKPPTQAWLQGLTAVVTVGWLVGFSIWKLAADAVRVGAATFSLGLGAGIAAIFSATASYGTYGLALCAGAGGFLLPQMIQGKKSFAGALFTVSAMLLAGLVIAGAMILAALPWYCALLLALVPVAARLPGPEKAPVWLQVVIFSLYGLVVAAAVCALAWPSSQST